MFIINYLFFFIYLHLIIIARSMRFPLILTIITFGVYRICLYFTGAKLLSLTVFLIPVMILMVGLLLRNKLRYRRWFIDPKNPLTEKEVRIFSSDIAPNLLFDKIKNVIGDSDLKLVDENRDQWLLLATTSINFLTWGENIYIQINPKEQNIQITSTTIFGNYSWNRNTSNQDNFFHLFEESLTI